MSVVTPDQFLLAVMTQDEKTLTMAQGVGKKMAQRIEETANEMEAQGYQFITCSVTPSARAILIFRETGERKSSPAAPITERDL